MSEELIMAEGTRLGSRALFYQSIISLASNIILPFFVSEAGSRKRMQSAIALGVEKTWYIRFYEKVKVHLGALWAVAHLLFAVCMVATFFYSSVGGATVFTAITGLSWAVVQWAPFSLLAEAILSEDGQEDRGSILLNDTRSRHADGTATENEERQFLVGEDEDDYEEVRSFRSSASIDSQDGEERERHNNIMGNVRARTSHLEVHTTEDTSMPKRSRGGGLAAKAGIILGIHNIFIVIPQFVMSGISSIIFAIMEPGKSAPEMVPDSGNVTMPMLNSTASLMPRDEIAITSQGGGPNSYAIVFRLGGLSAIVACVLTIRLVRDLKNR